MACRLVLGTTASLWKIFVEWAENICNTIYLDDDVTGGLGPEGSSGCGPQLPGVLVPLGQADADDDCEGDDEEDAETHLEILHQ